MITPEPELHPRSLGAAAQRGAEAGLVSVGVQLASSGNEENEQDLLLGSRPTSWDVIPSRSWSMRVARGV